MFFAVTALGSKGTQTRHSETRLIYDFVELMGIYVSMQP
jgi:hypothetical protein